MKTNITIIVVSFSAMCKCQGVHVYLLNTRIHALRTM